MAYVITLQPIPTLGVEGTADLFPVNRIFCVGRNYADHAREMGGNPDREPPFFFMKPGTCVVPEGPASMYPSLSEDVHHEFEMVVAIGTGGTNIATADAPKHIYGYGAGLDMTRRDLQALAKKLARPWDAAKAFDSSAPCSKIAPARHDWPSEQGSALARRQRQARAEFRSLCANLERARNHCRTLALFHAAAGRFDLYRHARRRRPCQARRCAARSHRRRRRPHH